MKALVLNALGRGFDFEEVQIAAPIGREVLVNVQASGLCLTDMLFATHDIVPTPAVLGHEVGSGGSDSRKYGSEITSWVLWRSRVELALDVYPDALSNAGTQSRRCADRRMRHV